jgi:predicted nucleotide-binding protein (sugar kinase/HSP70/actin superfamily)
MTQTFWGSETVESEQVQTQQPEAEQKQEQEQSATPEPAAQPETLAVNVDEFSALEDRVMRTVALVKRERQARVEAEQKVVQTESDLLEQMTQADRLQTEVVSLRTERDQVRQRVERMLAQLDALEV